MNKEFVCFSQQLMSFLTGKGFVLKNMRKDYKNEGRNIFIFNNSNELQKSIKEYQRPNVDIKH